MSPDPTPASPSKTLPMKYTLCSSRRLVSSSAEEKLTSRDTTLHFRSFLGTRAGEGGGGGGESPYLIRSQPPTGKENKLKEGGN